MRRRLLILLGSGVLSGCATRPVPAQLRPSTEADEAAYAPYLVKGTASLSGQAFLVQRGGGTVKAAGRVVTLDPATPIGDDWWWKAGKIWGRRSVAPASKGFKEARRTAIADADGRFQFTELPPGSYYLRTELTWEVPYHGMQGGVIGRRIEVRDGTSQAVVLNDLAS